MKRPRPFQSCACGDHAWVVLTKGYVALVDPDPPADLTAWNWHANMSGEYPYAARRDADDVKHFMHRAICPSAEWVDHKNGNALDNRSHNLRPCSRQQNWKNRRSNRGSSSRFRGVAWSAKQQRWRATISADGQQQSLGSFTEEEAAARAYDKVAVTAHGEFARLNFPTGPRAEARAQ